MWGISPVMRPTPPWARRGKHIAGTRRWLELRSEEWHNVEVSKTTVMLLKPCCKTQYSATYFHFVFFPAPSITMLHYSTGCSVIGSSASEPFALQAGAWRPSASTAWRWGLLFICRLRANCYSIALTTQRCILCPRSLSSVKAFTQNIQGTNLFPVWQHEAEMQSFTQEILMVISSKHISWYQCKNIKTMMQCTNVKKMFFIWKCNFLNWKLFLSNSEPTWWTTEATLNLKRKLTHLQLRLGHFTTSLQVQGCEAIPDGLE